MLRLIADLQNRRSHLFSNTLVFMRMIRLKLQELPRMDAALFLCYSDPQFPLG